MTIKKENKMKPKKDKIQIQIMYHYNYDGDKVYHWEAMAEEFEEELSKLDESVIVMCSVEAKDKVSELRTIIKEGSGSKDLINCYCTYKWDYDSIEEMYDKWEEDDSTLHTMVVFRADGVVLILTDNDKEEKISYETFVKYINDGSIGELYDWEVE